MVRAVRRWRISQRPRLGSERADHGIDDVEDRLRRAEARRDRKVAEFPRAPPEEVERIRAVRKRIGEALEVLARLLETSRIGALEAIDRLLEVADHEQGPVALLAFARAAEEFLDQPRDDLPLRGVGVLRLVDQDMIDLAIELVTDPVPHPRLREQAPSPFDEVVEIGHSGSALGLGIGRGKRLPGAEAG